MWPSWKAIITSVSSQKFTLAATNGDNFNKEPYRKNIATEPFECSMNCPSIQNMFFDINLKSKMATITEY